MKKRTVLALFAALTMSVSSMAVFSSCDVIEGIPVVGPFISGLFGAKKEAKSLSVKTKPTKTEYLVGEKFDPKGMEIEVVYSDKTTEVITEYEYSPKGELSLTDKKIKITSGELETTLTIKVSDPVTAIEKVTNPTKTEYRLAEKFDPAGMQLKVTYHSGKVETIDATKLSGLKYNYDEEIGLTTENSTLIATYGDIQFEIQLQLDYRVYIEAEYGLLNGAEPNSSTTNDGGNYGMDAALANAQEGAQQLFEAQLKADFALAELKKDPTFDAEALEATTVTLSTGAERDGLYNAIIEWIAANQEAVTAYTETDEYKKAVEDYLASEQYVADSNQYRASNDIYLGGLGKGSIVTFSFEADEAGKSDIAFRMAGAWLYEASSWNPIVMKDLQFNVLCEFYVNGIKYEIPDSVILPGGRTADGSTCQNLWVNWQEVDFEGIDVVEGRNVIELRVLYHNLKSPAQPSYSFSANVDSLVVTPKDGIEVNPYRGKLDAEYAANAVKIEEKDGKAQVVIDGEIEGLNGYAGDLVNITLYSGTTANAGAALVKTSAGKFNALVDVTAGDLGTYKIMVDGKAVKAADLTFTAGTISIGANSYVLGTNENGEVILTIDSMKKIVVNSATMPEDPTVDLVAEGDKVYVVIGGGTVDYEVKGYSAEEAEPVIEEAIAALYYMDFQRNGGSWDNPIGKNFHKANLLENNKFEMLLDVTDAANFEGVQLMLHFVHKNADGSVGTGGELDFKPSIPDFTKSVTVGTVQYTLTLDAATETCFGLPFVVAEKIGQPKVTIKNVVLEERGGKAVMVLTGTAVNVTEAIMATYVIDGEATQGRVVFAYTYTLGADGALEIVIDCSDIAIDGFYYMHAGFGEEPGNLEGTVLVEGKSELTVGNRKYVLGEQWSCRGITITEAVTETEPAA